MKKLAVIFVMLLMSTVAANADCSDFQCPAEYKTSNGFSKFMGSVTGTNFVARKTAESIVKKSIERNSKGDFDVEIDSFSAADLAAGRFKSLKITGKNIVSDDVYLSYLNLKTICDYNYIIYNKKNKTATFKENFGMTFGAVMTENDINNSMNSTSYKRLLDDINAIGKNTMLYNIKSSRVQFANNKLLYVLKVGFPLVGGTKTIVISSDVNVHNGKIILAETEVMNEKLKVDLSKITYLLNNLNPLNFSLKILENKDANLQVQEAVIKDNKINVNGIITVDKDVVTECKD